MKFRSVIGAARAIGLSFFIALCSCVAFAQTYEDMVVKARAGDANVDFKAMRLAFVTSKSPGVDPKLRTKLSDSIKAKKNDETAKAVEEILRVDFVNANLHALAAQAYLGS